MRFGHARRRGLTGWRQRGAVLLELAILSPVLAALGFGVLEYGVALQRTNSTLDAARGGARVGAQLGNNYTTDHYILDGVRANLSSQGLLGSLQKVVIYKASSATAPPPASCTATTPSGTCDVYGASAVTATALNRYNSTTGCPTTSFQLAGWCPSSRNDIQTTADYVGVAVIVQCSYFTKFFGSTYTIQRYAVMRIEPSEN